jgi:hypothetical protein
LKYRLKAANTVEMDPQVVAAKLRMLKEWIKLNESAPRVVDRRLAISDPQTFPKEIFLDEAGNDKGGPPLMLENLNAGQRQKIHAAAGRLFTRTTITKLFGGWFLEE